MTDQYSAALLELHLGKLVQLGATQKFISQWVPSATRLRYIWSKYGHPSTKKNKLSWMRTRRDNARLAEVIYATFARLYPNNKDLRFVLAPYHYLDTHLAVICRENNHDISVMYTISVLSGIISRELVVQDECISCGGVRLAHVEDYYLECALCRIVRSKLTKQSA